MDDLPAIDEGSVLVGIDGSDDARAALRWAFAEAELRGTTVVAVSVWQYPLKGVPTNDPDAPPVDPDALERERVKEFVVETLGADDGARVTVEAVFGYPGKVLAALAEKASLVVVGPRGHGGIAKLALGSTADHLVKNAPVPVVVVHR